MQEHIGWVVLGLGFVLVAYPIVKVYGPNIRDYFESRRR